MELGVEVLK